MPKTMHARRRSGGGGNPDGGGAQEADACAASPSLLLQACIDALEERWREPPSVLRAACTLVSILVARRPCAPPQAKHCARRVLGPLVRHTPKAALVSFVRTPAMFCTRMLVCEVHPP